MTKTIAIGIDLGTTYSCVAVCRNDYVEVIANNLGNRTTPSYVCFTPEERLIGDTALQKVGNNYKNTVYDAKRLIGRKFTDPEVQLDMKNFPFNVIEKYDKPYIQVTYKNEIKEFTPEEISSMVLTYMKETADNYLGQITSDAVITVPAYFNDSQRRATRDAASIAGLNVLRIINEPTAAALAYGYNKKINGKENILIVDLGGGTFDVTLLTINEGIFMVKATSGDTHLGGEDFTNRLVDYFIEEFKRKKKKDISNNKKSKYRLRTACERAKRILSDSVYAPVEIDCLYEGIDFYSGITRATFEKINSDLFEMLLEPISTVIKDSGLKKSEIDKIVLVGGSTRIPKIQKIISSYFSGKNLEKTINPDEAVACGAAIEAAKLSGDTSKYIQNLKLQDVTSLSLGVDRKGTLVDVVIKRNSPIPIKKTVTRCTVYDNQTSIRFRVCQGERALVKDNNILDELILKGIKIAPRGEMKYDLTYAIDSNGILNVSAIERGTGLSKEIAISNDKGIFYQEEIERLIEQAKRYKMDDEKAKERINAMNRLDDYAYELRNNLKNNIFISEMDQIKLTNIINYTIDWVKDNQNASKEEYEQRKKNLEEIASPILLF